MDDRLARMKQRVKMSDSTIIGLTSALAAVVITSNCYNE